jgi:hypothetical protein
MARAGLSRLSVWWIEQGIEVEFTRPAHPQDNGSHERMHEELEADTTCPPSPNWCSQQRRFDRWRKEYNEERPHEALEQNVPAHFYHRSERRLNENDISLVSYPAHFETKKLNNAGVLLHGGLSYFVGEALANTSVGLWINDAGETELHFANIRLGILAFGKEGHFLDTAHIKRALPSRNTGGP